MAVAALLGVLGSGLLRGVLIGVGALARAAPAARVAPARHELGRVPGTAYFADLIRHPENERVPDVLVVRSEGALLYFNVDHVRDRCLGARPRAREPPRLVVFFMGNVPHVDLAGAELLTELHDVRGERGIEFRLAETHGTVREALRRLARLPAGGFVEAHQRVDECRRRGPAGRTSRLPVPRVGEVSIIMALPRYPSLYQINTRVWLTDLSRAWAGRHAG